MSTIQLRKIAQYLVYLTLFTPLLFLPKIFVFPYIVPKVVVFRSLVLLALALTLIIWLHERRVNGEGLSLKNRIKKFFTPITIVLFLFFVSLIISTFLGVDWHYSFWNNHERMLGLFTIFHYFILFFVVRYLFTNWQDWKRLIAVFTGVGMMVVGIGIMQKIKPDFLLNRGAGQVVSTLGNPIYLAGYGLFLFFINLLCFIKEKNWFKWFWVVGALLGLVGIFISGTRGTFLGLLAGGFISGLLYIIFSQGKKKIKNIFTAVMVGLILLGGLSFVFRSTDFVKNIPTVGRLANASLFEGTGATRLMAWGIAVEAWQEKPVFGWGPNNYYYAFNKYYNPEFLKFGFQETWWDNAHNVLLNTLATQGAIGFVAYLAIFFFAISSLYKIYKKDNENLSLFIISTGFLSAHFVHNLFVFENPVSYLYFFLFLAMVDSFYSNRKELPNVEKKEMISKFVFAGVLLVVLFFIFTTNINVAAANIQLYNTRKILAEGKVKESLVEFEKTKKWYSPYQWDINWDYAMDILYVLPRVYSANQELSRQIYDTGVEAMKEVVELRPLDVRARLAYMDLLRSGGMVLFEIDGTKEIVEENLRISKELSPNRQQLEYAEITLLAGTGEFEQALELSIELVKNDPEIADGYYTLAQLYRLKNDHYKVLEVLDQAIKAGIRFTYSEHQILAAEEYELLGRFRDALYWYDQAYKSTGNERIKYKRDELSQMTQKPVPQSLEEFFNFAEAGSDDQVGGEEVEITM